MRVGVCIVTCDRPEFLDKTIWSLRGDYSHIIVVDNGVDPLPTKEVAIKHNSRVIDGGRSNSPHGQNLGLEYLAQTAKCDVILKSDDDILYGPDYVTTLCKTYRKFEGLAAAVCGTCWSEPHSETIHKEGDRWLTEEGKQISGECVIMYRFREPCLTSVRHMHGSFLYSVEEALQLREKTLELRGGAFPEYYSPVAHREETEFSLCLKQIQRKLLIYNSHAVCYHHYAPGGIRKHKDWGYLQHCDDIRFRNIVGKLKLDATIDPNDVGVLT